MNVSGTCLTELETGADWYQVNGTGNAFKLNACASDPSTGLGISVFTGNCTQLTCIEHESRQVANCNANGYSISWVTELGKTYRIMVSGLPIGVDIASSSNRRRLEPNIVPDFTLDIVEQSALENSDCQSSSAVAFETPVPGTTVGDSDSLTVYNTCSETKTERTGAWYTVSEGTPTEDGVIVYEANTCNAGSNFYNAMSVFRGDCGSLACVDVDVLPCQNGWFGQQVYWTTARNETFQIFVHSADTIEASLYGAGSFQMKIAYSNRIENDQCGTAVEMDTNNTDILKGSTSGSKPDMNAIEGSSCGTGGAGAWYRITGTGAVFQASTCNGDTDHKTAIQVFSGKCGSLNCIGQAGGNRALCSDASVSGMASVVNFETEVFVDYYILVTPRKEGKTGSFGLEITQIVPSEGNQCSKSLPLALDGALLTGSTLGATADFQPGEVCGVPLDTPGIWYSIEGTGKGLAVSLCNNVGFDAAISVFTGPSCDDLKCVTGTSAIDPACDNGQGVAAAFSSESLATYYIYVHGALGSPYGMGDFGLSSTEFKILQSNEFCPDASSIATDGSQIQGSTEDATHASIPSSSCGIQIENPGLWYTFTGNGQPFEILACSEDVGDFDTSVSVFMGTCDELSCVTGATFTENFCSNAQARERYLQTTGSPGFQFVTENLETYYLFVHGTGGVGDFDLFVKDMDLVGFGTASPTTTPIKYGTNLFRWTPVGVKIVIPTDYLSQEIVVAPNGTATVDGYLIDYVPPPDFSGEDYMTVRGCIGPVCYRFNITVIVMGDGNDPAASATTKGSSKLLAWLLPLILIPCLCICISVPLFIWYRKKTGAKNNDNMDGEGLEDEDRGVDDDDGSYDEEDGTLLPHESNIVKRGASESSINDDEDWESSDNDGSLDDDSDDDDSDDDDGGDDDSDDDDDDDTSEESDEGFSSDDSSSDRFTDE